MSRKWMNHCATRKLLHYNLVLWGRGGLFVFWSLAESAIMSVNIHINSPNVQYTDTHITARYSYQTTSVHTEENNITVTFLSPRDANTCKSVICGH